MALLSTESLAILASFFEVSPPDRMFQKRRVSSAAADTIVFPSGDCAMCSTRLVCPVSSATLTMLGYFHCDKTARGHMSSGEGVRRRGRGDAGEGGGTQTRSTDARAPSTRAQQREAEPESRGVDRRGKGARIGLLPG